MRNEKRKRVDDRKKARLGREAKKHPSISQGQSFQLLVVTVVRCLLLVVQSK